MPSGASPRATKVRALRTLSDCATMGATAWSAAIRACAAAKALPSIAPMKPCRNEKNRGTGSDGDM